MGSKEGSVSIRSSRSERIAARIAARRIAIVVASALLALSTGSVAAFGPSHGRTFQRRTGISTTSQTPFASTARTVADSRLRERQRRGRVFSNREPASEDCFDEDSTSTTPTPTPTTCACKAVPTAPKGSRIASALPLPLGLALGLSLALAASVPLPASAGFGPSSGATTTSPPNLNSITTNARRIKTTTSAAAAAAAAAATGTGAEHQKANAGANANSNSNANANANASPDDYDDYDADAFGIDLGGKKLRILIDSALNSRQLEEFSGQLDALIDSIQESLSGAPTGQDDEGEGADPRLTAMATTPSSSSSSPSSQAPPNSRSAREAELEQARLLREQIQKQEQTIAKLENQPYWFNYFAAFCGSTVSTLVMHPIDTIKTRLQVGIETGEEEEEEDEETNERSGGGSSIGGGGGPQGAPLLGSGTGYGNATGALALVASTAAVAATATATASARATAAAATTGNLVATPTPLQPQIPRRLAPGTLDNLYEGLTGNLFKEVPPSAVYLGVYETIKYALSPMVPQSCLLWVYLVAGSAGEVVGSIIRAPAEAVKSLVQSRAKDNALEAAEAVLGTKEGRANVVRAWSASVVRDVPFGGIQLAVFETVKAAILNEPSITIDSSTLLSEAIIGALAGGIGAFVTAPADVVTTRIITQETGGEESRDGEPGALGVVEMARKIYREEGAGAFFIGWEARVGYWAPAIGIFLSCYCTVRQLGITYDLFS